MGRGEKYKFCSLKLNYQLHLWNSQVCTFQLVLKNAASLLDNNDPIKLEAEASLRDLVRYFTALYYFPCPFDAWVFRHAKMHWSS